MLDVYRAVEAAVAERFNIGSTSPGSEMMCDQLSYALTYHPVESEFVLWQLCLAAALIAVL